MHFLRPFSLNHREIFAIYFRILNIAIKYYNLYLLIRTCTIHISVNFILWNAGEKRNNNDIDVDRPTQTKSVSHKSNERNRHGSLLPRSIKWTCSIIFVRTMLRISADLIPSTDKTSVKCFNYDFFQNRFIWFWDLGKFCCISSKVTATIGDHPMMKAKLPFRHSGVRIIIIVFSFFW